MKILIVEDDIKISAFLKKGLIEEGYICDISYDGEDAKYLIESNIYDVVLLDVMIPTIDGMTLCKQLRETNISVPIIMLTAKSSIEDKVIGLTYGANDYITKPFSFDELLARIKVQLRTGKNLTNILTIGDLELNLDTKIVKRDDKIIEFTAKEYALFEYLLLNKDNLVTEDMINNALWNMDESTASNIVSVYMYRIRTKVDKQHNIKFIHTLRGRGYKVSEHI